jgi:hypothetical protein
VRRGSPLPVATPPRLFEHRKRLRRHPNTDLTKGGSGSLWVAQGVWGKLRE